MANVYLIAGEVACKFKDEDTPFVETLTAIVPIEAEGSKFTLKALTVFGQILEAQVTKYLASVKPEVEIESITSRVFSVSHLGEMTMEEFNDLEEENKDN
jgi:hypothetical protein